MTRDHICPRCNSVRLTKDGDEFPRCVVCGAEMVAWTPEPQTPDVSETITVELPAPTLDALYDLCRDAGTGDHGALNVERLTQMILSDLALLRTRPGCWEAEAMAGWLAGHGYHV